MNSNHTDSDRPQSPDPDSDAVTFDDEAITVSQSRRSSHGGGKSWVFPVAVAVLAVAIIGLLTVFADDAGDGPTDAAASGDPADHAIFGFPFTNDDGTTGTLGDFQGQPLVVNFFASWCPPCRAELPDFEAVHQANGDQVTFVGINQDFSEESWRAFVDESQISYDTVFQPGSEVWNELATQAMPSTAFISPDGEILQVWAGLLTDDKLQELIDLHLLEQT